MKTRLLCWLALPLLLAGCGQKGPLYFPDQAPAHKPAHHSTQLLQPTAHEPSA